MQRKMQHEVIYDIMHLFINHFLSCLSLSVQEGTSARNKSPNRICDDHVSQLCVVAFHCLLCCTQVHYVHSLRNLPYSQLFCRMKYFFNYIL